jgi:D-alanine-D-alanine ligase-like ATP-grasp enzyme
VPLTTFDPIVNFIDATLGQGLPFNETSLRGNHRGFIVDAARQRGLTVKNLSRDQVAFFEGDVAVGGMYKMVTSLVSHPAINMTNSKPMTKELMAKAKVPVPSGRAFSQGQYDQALEYFEQQQSPQVVKPANGRAGLGISTQIQTAQQFHSAWLRAIEASTSKAKILIEQHVTGLDVRAFVVGNRVVASATRLPAFVVGNGYDSIATLVDAKADLRAKNGYLRSKPIQIDADWLGRRNLTTTSVPSEGEVVLLNGTVNLHQGGEQVDLTDILSPELQDIAVRAARAIPGLTIAGIDLLVESPTSTRNAVVLEANTSANISVHHIPAYGKPVDVAGAIIDEMLRNTLNTPKTDNNKKNSSFSLLMRAQRLNQRISQTFKLMRGSAK